MADDELLSQKEIEELDAEIAALDNEPDSDYENDLENWGC